MPQPQTSRSSSRPAAAGSRPPRPRPQPSPPRSRRRPPRPSAPPSAAGGQARRAAKARQRPRRPCARTSTALRDALRKGVVSPPTASRPRSTTPSSAGASRARTPPSCARACHARPPQADDFRADLEQLLGRGRSRARSSERPRAARGRRPGARRASARRSRSPVRRADRRADPTRLNDLTPAQLRKVRDYETRNANRKSVLGAIEKKLGLNYAGGHGRPHEDPRRARRRARADASTASPSAAPAWRAATATSSSSAAPCPATACARWSPSASAPTPRRARVEMLEPAPDRIEPVAPHPGAPWQVLPYERQLEIKAEQVDDALRRIGQLEGFELAADRPRGRAVALPQQARVLVRHRRTTASWSAASTRPGSWERIEPVEDCLLASERGNEARRAVLRLVPRAGPERLRPPRADRPAAQPRRARGPAHRRAAGPPRHLRRGGRPRRPRRGGRRRQRPVDPRARRRRDDRGRRHRVLRGTEAIDEELGGLRFRIGADAFFQTNTEMAERLYALAGRVRRPAGLGARLRPVLRDRHDRPVAGAARRRGLGAGDRRGGDRRRDRQRAAQRDRQRALLRRRRAPGAARARRDGRPPRRRWSSTRRARASRQKVVRRVIEAAPERIVYVSCNPTTLAPNAAQLVEAGYALRRVRPVDMFPQTPHIECVALLERA